MRSSIRTAIVVTSLVLVAGCTQLSAEDKATLAAASTNAEQAKAVAQQALDAARSAQSDAKLAAQAANNAAQAATQAAQAAREETEKVDRMFNHSQRKTSGQ